MTELQKTFKNATKRRYQKMSIAEKYKIAKRELICAKDDVERFGDPESYERLRKAEEQYKKIVRWLIK